MSHGCKETFKATEVYLGEADGEDGVGAAAGAIHACAGCGAVGIAENDQILHVTVLVYRMFGQIYFQIFSVLDFLYYTHTHLRWTCGGK